MKRNNFFMRLFKNIADNVWYFLLAIALAAFVFFVVVA